ncbi:MAG: penicillin acylase family protein [Candidatus Baltobacteraceae bacterium]
MLGVLGLLVVLALVFSVYLALSWKTALSKTDGEMKLAGLQAAVEIIRDERDVPHIRAQNLHDLFFAQGFAEGSDRLFQFDLTRHFVYGRLAEWFGTPAFAADQRSRTIDVRGIVQRQWRALSNESRDELNAFADGINAAQGAQPLPFEYRLFFLRPERWQGPDSLAVGFATVLALADGYRDVLSRNAVYRKFGVRGYDIQYPLTDPKYDSPTVGRARRHDFDLAAPAPLDEPRAQASNEWAAGGAHTTTGRALLANDPHLDLSIPGIWYLVDLQAPGFHVAGASLAGTPGVILGHNDSIAWGATNGTVAALSLFRIRTPIPKSAEVVEHFEVRLKGSSDITYYREARGFYVQDGKQTFLVSWSTYSKPGSPLDAFDGLDRARSIEDGLKALRKYPGPTQNFVLAGIDGRAAYTLAGWIPNDPLWARHAHDESYRTYPTIPFAALPHVTPSRDAVVWTSNNRMYGDGYPYRLSATFSPPYRAYEVRRQLQARKKYDVAYFSQMQNDTFSVAELELSKFVLAAAGRNPKLVAQVAPLLRELRRWNGYMSPDSHAATVAHAIRLSLVTSYAGRNTSVLLQTLRMHAAKHDRSADKWLLTNLLANAPSGIEKPWGAAGAVPMLNPLDSFGIGWLNGAVLPGNGDNYTVHAQNTNFNQSFRAVWDVGNWDAGGIVIPAGESGEPGSPHYQDLTATYNGGRLAALPFTHAAVQAHAVSRQQLLPP